MENHLNAKSGQTPAAGSSEPMLDALTPDELSAAHSVIAAGEPQRVGRSWYFLGGQRSE